MKGLILAGGSGTRLRPLTYYGPKQLIPVANKPILHYAIEDLVEAGITDIGIVLGNKGRDEIRSKVGDGSKFGADVSYIIQGDPLGIAHAVECARDFVDGDDFVLYLGDNLLDQTITDPVHQFETNDAAANILLKPVTDPREYGIVELDRQDNIIRLEEKPDNPTSNLAIIGVYLFSSRIYDAIEHIEPSWRGELEITDAIQYLINDGQDVASHTVTGWWKDVARPADVLDANIHILKNRTKNNLGSNARRLTVDGGAEIHRTANISETVTINPPVSIGSNVSITGNAIIGPFSSIQSHTVITGAEIKESVLMENVRIEANNVFSRSLIGSDTEITDSFDDFEELSIVAGKDSIKSVD